MLCESVVHESCDEPEERLKQRRGAILTVFIVEMIVEGHRGHRETKTMPMGPSHDL